MKHTAKFSSTSRDLPLFTSPSDFLGARTVSSADGASDPIRHLVYCSNTAMVACYVTANCREFLGVTSEKFVGNSDIWKEIVPESDRHKVIENFTRLRREEQVFFLHRLLDQRGLPVWVSHRIRAIGSGELRALYGCITPIPEDGSIRLLEPDLVAGFIHKLGNYFQLLNLAFNSFGKENPAAPEIRVVQETLDRAVSFSRAFSEFIQIPTATSVLAFEEIIEAATVSQEARILDHQVDIESEYAPETREIPVQGDPYLLEIAIGAVLQNALEATPQGGKVRVQVSGHYVCGVPEGVKITVTDSGAGIAECDLSRVAIPFFSTKVNHEGLGLSTAFRFVELHGGILRIKSAIGTGTQIEILLPRDGIQLNTL